MEPYHLAGLEQSRIWRFMGIVSGRPGTQSQDGLSPPTWAGAVCVHTEFNGARRGCYPHRNPCRSLGTSLRQGGPSFPPWLGPFLISYAGPERRNLTARAFDILYSPTTEEVIAAFTRTSWGDRRVHEAQSRLSRLHRQNGYALPQIWGSVPV